MRVAIIRGIIAGAAIAGGVAGCGGGDSPTSDTAQSSKHSAEGLWNGTTTTGRTVTTLVLDDGTYWVVYSAAGNSAVLGGVAEGNSVSNNGQVSSSNGLDVNLEGFGVNAFTMSGTYTPNGSLNGTLQYPQTSQGFTAAYDTDYDLTPSLATIAGDYSGVVDIGSGLESVLVTVTSDGHIGGMGASGCTFTGIASLHAHGNVYNPASNFRWRRVF